MELALGPGAGLAIHELADLDRYLGATAAAGFTGVSLGLDQLAGDPAGAASLVARHGLRCTDLLSLRVTRDDADSLRAARALRPAVEAMRPDSVCTLVWTRPSAATTDRLGRVADELGVPLGLEFGPATLPTIEAASALVTELGPARVTVVADTFHFFRSGSTWPMLDSVPVENIGVVQFDDALPAVSDDYVAETENRRAWPGDGELPLKRFTATLRERGWNGVVSVEVLSEQLRALPVEEFARHAYQTCAPYWT
jgi:sugar phosphate isomerase/epimerase